MASPSNSSASFHAILCIKYNCNPNPKQNNSFPTALVALRTSWFFDPTLINKIISKVATVTKTKYAVDVNMVIGNNYNLSRNHTTLMVFNFLHAKNYYQLQTSFILLTVPPSSTIQFQLCYQFNLTARECPHSHVPAFITYTSSCTILPLTPSFYCIAIQALLSTWDRIQLFCPIFIYTRIVIEFLCIMILSYLSLILVMHHSFHLPTLIIYLTFS